MVQTPFTVKAGGIISGSQFTLVKRGLTPEGAPWYKRHSP